MKTAASPSRNRRALRLALGLVLAVVAPVQAQPTQGWGDVDARTLPETVLPFTFNTIRYADEVKTDRFYFYSNLSVSQSLTQEPFLYLGTDAHQVLAGAQLLTRVSPFFDNFSFTGLRYVKLGDPFTLTAWMGQTPTLSSLAQGALPVKQTMAGALLNYAPNPRHAYAVMLMPYQNGTGTADPQGLLSGTVVLGEALATDHAHYLVTAAAGLDRHSRGRTDTAYALSANYHQTDVNAQLSLLNQPLTFGPQQTPGYQGQDNALFTADWRVSPVWSTNVSYQRSSNALFGFDQSTADLAVTRHLSKQFDIRAEALHVSSSVPGISNQARTFGRLEASYHHKKFALRANTQVASNGDRQVGFGATQTIPLTRTLSARLNYDTNSVDVSQGIITSSQRFDLSLRGRLSDRGTFTLGLGRQSQVGATTSASDQMNSAIDTPLGGGLVLNGAYAANPGSNYARAELRYATGPHSELKLQYYRAPGQFFQVAGRSLPTPSGAALTWTHSFNGPSQERISQERGGAVSVQVGPPAGTAMTSTSGRRLRVRLAGQEHRLDDRGRTLFTAIPPGPYTLELVPATVDSHTMVVNGPTSEPVQLRPGQHIDKTFSITLRPSLRIVVFNDLDGRGKPTAGYLPYLAAPVRVDDNPPTPLDPQGQVYLDNLSEGPHRVRLPASTLPPGMESTTPLDVTIELHGGEAATVPFGVQGFGMLETHVVVRPEDKSALQRLAHESILQLNGRMPVPLEEEPHRLPATTYSWALSHGVNLNWYLEGTPDPKLLDIGVNRTTPLVLQLTRYAALRVRLAAPGHPLSSLEGVAVTVDADTRPYYMDATGTVLIKGLKAGPHTVKIAADSLPAGVNGGEDTVVLHSGEVRDISIGRNPSK